MANNKIKGITIEIGGDTTDLSRALSGIETAGRNAAAELRSIDRVLQADPENAELLRQQYEVLGNAVSAAREKLELLQRSQEQVQAQFENGDISAEQYRAFRREISQAESALNRLVERQEDLNRSSADTESQISETSEALRETGENADNAESSISDLSAATVAKGQLMADAIKAVASELINLADNTRDLRESMAKLDSNAASAGASADTMRNALRDLNAVSGETDSNIEALSNLLKSGMSENQILTALEDLSGAVIAFPDTLKLESLADGLQETLATGAGAGAFAELMERSGKNIDDFNAGLADAMEQGRQYDYVLQELASTGLSQVNQAYRENNEILINAKNAQYDIEQATANAGAAAEKAITSVRGEMAQLINDNIDEITAAIDNVGNAVVNATQFLVEHGSAVKASAAAYITFSAAVKTAQGVLGLVTAIKGLTAATGTATGATAALNTTILANPYVAVGAAIAAMVAALVTLVVETRKVGEEYKDMAAETERISQMTEKTAENTEKEITILENKIKTYEELRVIENRTEEQERLLQDAMSDINAMVPIHIEFIDEQTGAYKSLAEQIDTAKEAMRRQAEFEGRYEQYKEAVKQVESVTKSYENATAAYDEFLNSHNFAENPVIASLTLSGKDILNGNKLKEEQQIAKQSYDEITKIIEDFENDFVDVSEETEEAVEMYTNDTIAAYGEGAQKQANAYANEMRKLSDSQAAEFRKFSEKQKQLKYKYDTADVQDEAAYYAELEQLLEQYGDESSEKYQSYYISIADYKRKQRENSVSEAEKEAEELKTVAEKSAQERLSIIKEEIAEAQSQYEQGYNDLLSQRTEYADKLSSLSEIFRESTQTDESGKSNDVFELLNLDEGNKAIEEFDEKLSRLENRDISKGLSDYILSLSAEQGGKMMDILSNMTDDELSAYNSAFEKRQQLINERAGKRFAQQFDELNTQFKTNMADVFAGADDEFSLFGQTAVAKFAEGFSANSAAAVETVKNWCSQLSAEMENIANGTDLNTAIGNIISSGVISAAGNISVNAPTVDTAVNVPAKTDVSQTVQQNVTVSAQGISDIFNEFIGKLSNVTIPTENIGVDVNVTGSITDMSKNKIIDLIVNELSSRSMQTGAEVYSY